MNKEKSQAHIGKHEIEYLIEGLAAFYELRREGRVLLTAITRRLATEASSCFGDFKVLMRPEAGSTWVSWFSTYFTNMWHTAASAFYFLRLIPSFFKQRRKLEQMRASHGQICNTFIAIASRRLVSSKSNAGLRQYLISLARSFSDDSHETSIAKQIASSKYLLVFEAKGLSPLWKNKNACWRDGIFIVDTGFIGFIVIISLFKMAAQFVLNYTRRAGLYKVLKICLASPLRTGTLRSTVAAIIIAEGYKEVIQKSHSIKALFFTSNSFLTEILRVCLIQDRRCIAICEIMHGIPTTELERYLFTLLELGEKYDASIKHDFIPQLPGLPLYGIYKRLASDNGRTAINAYVNKYLIEHDNDDLDLEAFIESECKSILLDSQALNNTLIVAFTGAMALDKNYFGSNVFRIECLMMLHMKKVLNSLKQPFIIIYTPHPSHDLAAFSRCRFFSDEEILVYPDTIFTWLIADLCISPYSSALFEAAYCGVNSFTPMVPRDEIYPITLLDLLHYPKKETADRLVDELTRFILAHSHHRSVDVIQRANARLKLFTQT